MHTIQGSAPSSFSETVKSHLKKAIVTSKRRGAWFSLERREKSILYLSLKLNVRFESLELLRALASVLKKLEQQGETVYAWIQRGTKLAWVFSEFAASAGNDKAISWRNDRTYAFYLGRVLISTKRGPYST
ncbi:MAG TPA: hypothetical protein VGR56_01935 [Nitrososphaerales archaeon]|nr:hypothetical protein [Nitrososphaerales archaeon]